MSWPPTQYSKFENERNRPIADLLARIPTTDVAVAADIGCGPGNSTELLQARFPNATITGMDNSADMIAAAQKRLPQTRFEISDITTWQNQGPFDVILANASLQWVPNHAVLLPSLANKLSARGSLAIQMPDNLDEPAHRLMREVAAQGPWAHKLANADKARTERLSAEWYYSTLQNKVATVDVWRTTYYHPLAGGADAVVEWFKGTGLRPFLDPLDPGEKAGYLDQYKAEITKAYPAQPENTVLLPFPRLFIVATL